jgi:UrcA family protein
MFRTNLLPVLILAAGSLLGNAHAAMPPAITVSSADLDLSRPADVDTLYGRLRLAAMGACLPLPLSPALYQDWERCYSVVLGAAVRGMHSPALLARYRVFEQPVHVPERRG